MVLRPCYLLMLPSTCCCFHLSEFPLCDLQRADAHLFLPGDEGVEESPGKGDLEQAAARAFASLPSSCITKVDISEEALSLARSLGADHCINARQDPSSVCRDSTIVSLFVQHENSKLRHHDLGGVIARKCHFILSCQLYSASCALLCAGRFP